MRTVDTDVLVLAGNGSPTLPLDWAVGCFWNWERFTELSSSWDGEGIRPRSMLSLTHVPCLYRMWHSVIFWRQRQEDGMGDLAKLWLRHKCLQFLSCHLSFNSLAARHQWIRLGSSYSPRREGQLRDSPDTSCTDSVQRGQPTKLATAGDRRWLQPLNSHPQGNGGGRGRGQVITNNWIHVFTCVRMWCDNKVDSHSGGWEVHWTTLPEASLACRGLLRCGYKKGCSGKCKCFKAALPCTARCYCGWLCNEHL